MLGVGLQGFEVVTTGVAGHAGVATTNAPSPRKKLAMARRSRLRVQT